jgi:predicted amidophosphoribosyltransferase
MRCYTCEDGNNTDYLSEIASCTFGCGTVVNTDTFYCPTCEDHSANHATCEDCSQDYEDWNKMWEPSSYYIMQ